MIRKTIIMVLFISNTVIVATDYCKLCKKGSHTLCRYKEGPSDRCVEYKKPEFTSSAKKYIVDIHNDIRNHIASGQELKGALGRQPPASNMNILQWDNELADIAQRWADQCIGLNEHVQHDECRKTERFEVGQNIITAITPSLETPEIAILILNWYKQVENVLPSDIDNFSGIQRGKFLIGQYSQLVWAETRYLGCGMSTFKNFNYSSDISKYFHRLVCNYGPRGNSIGSPIYQRGIPCSKCPLGNCDSIRTSLCKADEEMKYLKPNEKKSNHEDFDKYHIDIPTFLFSSISLGYILEHNLTEFVQNLLNNMNLHFGYDHSIENTNQNIVYSIQNSHKTFKVDEILTIMATKKCRINCNSNSDTNSTTTDYKSKRKSFFGYNDKKFTDLLFYGKNTQNFDPNWYELKNGKIVVDDCKQHLHLSQFEEDEISTEEKIKSNEIVLPNNIVYKKFEGIWFHGRCRCNYVYRSSVENMLRYSFSKHLCKTLLILVVIICIQ